MESAKLKRAPFCFSQLKGDTGVPPFRPELVETIKQCTENLRVSKAKVKLQVPFLNESAELYLADSSLIKSSDYSLIGKHAASHNATQRGP